jgi:hypothetical protein
MDIYPDVGFVVLQRRINLGEDSNSLARDLYAEAYGQLYAGKPDTGETPVLLSLHEYRCYDIYLFTVFKRDRNFFSRDAGI